MVKKTEKQGEAQPQSANPLGGYLRAVRETKMRMNMADMATHLGEKQSTLGNYERGEIIPKPEFLAKFAQICSEDRAVLLTLALHSAGIEGVQVIEAGRGFAEPQDGYVNEPSTNLNEPVEGRESREEEGETVAGDVYVSIQRELLAAPDLAPLVLEYIRVMKEGRRHSAPGPRQAG